MRSAARKVLYSESYKESEVLFVFAIVESGGKQYKVSEGDIIFVEKLNVNEGDTYTFERFLRSLLRPAFRSARLRWPVL